jgi:hypothetical protein
VIETLSPAALPACVGRKSASPANPNLNSGGL